MLSRTIGLCGKKISLRIVLSGMIVIGIALLIPASCAPVEEWNMTFGANDYDYAFSVEQTQDGGYIIAGSTNSYGAGGQDAWLIKTNPDGKIQWSKTFGEKYDDQARSVQQTRDGGFILACSLTTSEYRYFRGRESPFGAIFNVKNDLMGLIKTDASGKKQWEKRFGDISIFGAISVEQTADGGFILAGMASPSGSINGGPWIIKTDAKGDKEWDRIFDNNVYGANFVQQTSDSGYILKGLEPKLFKIGQDGKEEWGARFQRKGLDYFSSIQETMDGGFIISGATQSYGADDSDAWLVKTDVYGNELWNRTYGTNIDHAFLARQTQDGGYIVAGWGLEIGTIDEDAFLIKTDVNGNEEWNMTFGEARAERIYSVQETSDGGYILAGQTGSYGEDLDAWLIKIAGGTIPSQTRPNTVEMPIEKSTPGFEILATIASIMIPYSKRKKQ